MGLDKKNWFKKGYSVTVRYVQNLNSI